MNAPVTPDDSRFTVHASRVVGRRSALLWWLVPLAGVLTLFGYFGPWVDHKVAGLAMLGIDLGEVVKFLPDVRSGQLVLWREGFYVPLVAVSLALSLCAFRAEFRYPWVVRALLLAGAGVAALNLLPPAWTPPRMLTPEFQQQTIAIGVCLAALALSPFLALLPARLTGGILLVLSLLAIGFPVWQFARVLPGIGVLYNHLLAPGWGVIVMMIGLATLAVAGVTMIVGKQKM